MQPAGRSRVPRPSAAAHVRRLGVHVACSDVGFHFVTLNTRTRVASVDWVEHSEKLGSLVAVAEHGERNHGPHSRVRILPAIFADAWRITSYIARIMPCIIERRS